MTDSAELKAAMVRKGVTANEISKLIGISRTTFSYKMNNKREFLASEIVAIQKKLGLTNGERDAIFFSGYVE